MSRIIVVIFFTSQIFSIVYQLNKDSKYFNWAMYHTTVDYHIKAIVDGVELSDTAFYLRFKMKSKGREGRSLQHIKNKVVAFEKIYGHGKTTIIIDYKENLKPGTWTWQNY